MSHCNACHQRAEQGSFSEREIVIKGIGRWDD
jgi:mono/diheme cytochrome c family protein